jgi:hypothetical protein
MSPLGRMENDHFKGPIFSQRSPHSDWLAQGPILSSNLSILTELPSLALYWHHRNTPANNYKNTWRHTAENNSLYSGSRKVSV